MRVRVYIATTEGPSLVQRIAPGDSDIPPVVCLNGTTEALAISGDYARFVRRGTGVVAKLTGHDSYRVDVDAPIDGGQSWQFGLLLAHLLAAEGRLAAPDQPADLTVFATGEIDRDLKLRPVGHIAEKRERAAEALTAAGNALFLVPSDEAADTGLIGIGALSEAADRLGLAMAGSGTALAVPPAPPRQRSGWSWAVAGVVLGAVAVAGYLGYRGFPGAGEAPAVSAPPSQLGAEEASAEGADASPDPGFPADGMAVAVVTWRAPEGFTCRSLRFAGLETVETVLTPAADGSYRSETRAAVCDVGYRIVNRWTRSVRATLSYESGGPTDAVETVLAPGGVAERRWAPEAHPQVHEVRFIVSASVDGRTVWSSDVRHRIDPATP